MSSYKSCQVCGGELETKEEEKLLPNEKKYEQLQFNFEECLFCGEHSYSQDTAKYFDDVSIFDTLKSTIGQRAENRLPAHNSRITLRKKGLLSLQRKINFNAFLVNLSMGGLQILTAELLKPGDNYNLTLFLPGFSDSLNVKAKVVWSKLFKKEFGKSYYLAGFKFIKLNQEIENYFKGNHFKPGANIKKY